MHNNEILQEIFYMLQPCILQMFNFYASLIIMFLLNWKILSPFVRVLELLIGLSLYKAYGVLSFQSYF